MWLVTIVIQESASPEELKHLAEVIKTWYDEQQNEESCFYPDVEGSAIEDLESGELPTPDSIRAPSLMRKYDQLISKLYEEDAGVGMDHVREALRLSGASEEEAEKLSSYLEMQKSLAKSKAFFERAVRINIRPYVELELTDNEQVAPAEIQVKIDELRSQIPAEIVKEFRVEVMDSDEDDDTYDDDINEDTTYYDD